MLEQHLNSNPGPEKQLEGCVVFCPKKTEVSLGTLTLQSYEEQTQ